MLYCEIRQPDKSQGRFEFCQLERFIGVVFRHWIAFDLRQVKGYSLYWVVVSLAKRRYDTSVELPGL